MSGVLSIELDIVTFIETPGPISLIDDNLS